MDKKVFVAALVLIPIAIFYLGFGFEVTVGVFIVGMLILFLTKKIGRMEASLGIVLFFTFAIAYFFYLYPSVSIATSQGTVLSDNWWEALNWIKNNTATCAPVATYWDPGHFITGIANRPVVFDGASQGATRTIVVNGTNVTTSRIQDIATILYTSDEEKAVDILRKYQNGNCSEMYFIASSDLIYKSVWWSYFATWDPAREGEKGDKYSYIPMQLSGRKPLIFAGIVGYEYKLSDKQSFILYDQNNTIRPIFQQENQFIKVKRLIMMTNNGYLTYDDPTAEIKGTIYSPGFPSDVIFYMPEEIENSMFTKMYFLNGYGLKHFTLVKNWGGEVKLFKVDLTETHATEQTSTQTNDTQTNTPTNTTQTNATLSNTTQTNTPQSNTTGTNTTQNNTAFNTTANTTQNQSA